MEPIKQVIDGDRSTTADQSRYDGQSIDPTRNWTPVCHPNPISRERYSFIPCMPATLKTVCFMFFRCRRTTLCGAWNVVGIILPPSVRRVKLPIFSLKYPANIPTQRPSSCRLIKGHLLFVYDRDQSVASSYRYHYQFIGILKKISHLLSTSVLLQLYNTLVQILVFVYKFTHSYRPPPPDLMITFAHNLTPIAHNS